VFLAWSVGAIMIWRVRKALMQHPNFIKKNWLYKNLLETIYLLKDNKVALIIFRHLKPFLK
jgi:hypothetical protein